MHLQYYTPSRISIREIDFPPETCKWQSQWEPFKCNCRIVLNRKESIRNYVIAVNCDNAIKNRRIVFNYTFIITIMHWQSIESMTMAWCAVGNAVYVHTYVYNIHFHLYPPPRPVCITAYMENANAIHFGGWKLKFTKYFSTRNKNFNKKRKISNWHAFICTLAAYFVAFFMWYLRNKKTLFFSDCVVSPSFAEWKFSSLPRCRL